MRAGLARKAQPSRPRRARGSVCSSPTPPRTASEQRYAPRPGARRRAGRAARPVRRVARSARVPLREALPASDAGSRRTGAALFASLRVACSSIVRRNSSSLRINSGSIDGRCLALRLASPSAATGSGSRCVQAFFALGKVARPRFVRFGFARDVEPPAGQPRGEPDVLTFASDRERELIVGDRDERDALVLEEFDAEHLGRRQRVAR